MTSRSRPSGDAQNKVQATLDTLAPDQRALADAVRGVIARSVPRATESVKWNAPSFALAEHFATFHLRSKVGIQLVLHLGAKGRPDVDLRTMAALQSELLEWKGADRAIVSLRDVDHVSAVRAELSRVLKVWSQQVVA